MSSLTDQRNALRSATLGRASHFERRTVETVGNTFEVKRASVGERGAIFKAAGVTQLGKDEKSADLGRLQAMAVCKLVLVPGTDVRVYEDSDMEMLLRAPCGSYVDELAKVAMEMLNVDAEDVKKNSVAPQATNGVSSHA